MTDRLPYADITTDMPMVFAITQGELPVDLSVLSTSSYIKSILENCWKLRKDLRPSMHECLAALFTKSPLLQKTSSTLEAITPAIEIANSAPIVLVEYTSSLVDPC